MNLSPNIQDLNFDCSNQRIPDTEMMAGIIHDFWAARLRQELQIEKPDPFALVKINQQLAIYASPAHRLATKGELPKQG